MFVIVLIFLPLQNLNFSSLRKRELNNENSVDCCLDELNIVKVRKKRGEENINFFVTCALDFCICSFSFNSS